MAALKLQRLDFYNCTMKHIGVHNIIINTLARGLLACLLLSSFVSVLGVQPSLAQTPPEDPSTLALTQFGIKDQTLRGPFDAAYLEFGLPENWRVTANGELQLDIESLLLGSDTSLNANTNPTQTTTARSTGLLNIKVNDVTVGNLPLGTYGKQSLAVTIPISAFVSPRQDGLNFIYIELTDYPRCDKDEQAVLFLRATSRLKVPHTIAPLQPNLRSLPRPFFQHSLHPDIATLVVPDQPSADELQAALNIAAGFGRMTNGKLGLTLTTESQLQNSGQLTTNLILVGKTDTLNTQFSPLKWPIPPKAKGFDNADIAPEDGVLQVLASPWDDSRALLWVSGETDAGLLKAARALSSGSVRALTTPNLAVVSGSRPPTDTAELPTEFDLAELGYDTQEFSGPGVRYTNYQFYVPDNMRTKSDAYFEVNFVHSALLDYASSGLIVTLNGENIGSVRFDDSSTLLSKERILIPADSIRSGKNDLGVQIDLAPRNLCGNSFRLWASIRRDSNLHLPLTPLPAGGNGARPNLSRYPKPFNTQPDLSHLAFMVAPGDVSGWQAATILAFQLGQNSAQQPLDIALMFSDNLNEQQRNERNLIIVGRPTKFPILQTLVDALPAPFAPGSDLATEPIEVEYRVPKNADIGYVQILGSPWNQDNYVLTVLGNTDAGLKQALNALSEPELRKQMTGNLAMLNNNHVYAADVRTQARKPIATVVPVAGKVAEAKTATPTWLLPTIVITIGGIFVLLSLLGFFWARRRRNQQYQAGLAKNPPRPRLAIAPPTQYMERDIHRANQWVDESNDDDDDADVEDDEADIDLQGRSPKPGDYPPYPIRPRRVPRQNQRPPRWPQD